jgi:hypothetical protein
VNIERVRTATDFQRTLAWDDYALHRWVSPHREVESEIRHAIDEIFSDDLAVVRGDLDLERSYMDVVAEPLGLLDSFGIQVVAVLTSGTLTFPEGTFGSEEAKQLPWRRAHYVVAPDPAYFRLKAEEPAVCHMLGVRCAGLDAFTRSDGASVIVYAGLDGVRRDFEETVPWCEDCGLRAELDDLGW